MQAGLLGEPAARLLGGLQAPLQLRQFGRRLTRVRLDEDRQNGRRGSHQRAFSASRLATRWR
jgi:hypothetical protein